MNKKKQYTRLVEPKNNKQKEFLESVADYPVTFAVGSAGSGKTFLATAKAVEYLNYGLVDKLVVVRPAVATEDLGFLPGDMKEKVDPYLLPIWDCLSNIAGPEKFRDMQEDKLIEIAPLAFMRGRTFSNAFIILDEAQNTTIDQMKMFLTRFGENVKVVITGDPTQSDIKGMNGLNWALEKLSECKSVNIIKYSKNQVVRSMLVKDILTHLERENAKNTSATDSEGDTGRGLPEFIIREPIG